MAIGQTLSRNANSVSHLAKQYYYEDPPSARYLASEPEQLDLDSGFQPTFRSACVPSEVGFFMNLSWMCPMMHELIVSVLPGGAREKVPTVWFPVLYTLEN